MYVCFEKLNVMCVDFLDVVMQLQYIIHFELL